jgi:competence protein ComEC
MSQSVSLHPQGSLLGQPLVVLGVCALLGSLAPTAAWPCLAAALVWLSCWAKGLRFAVVCLLAFALCGVLAEGKRGRFRRSWSLQAETLAGHHRCVLRGQVTSSPTARRALAVPDGLDESFLLSVRGGTCAEVPMAAGTTVRLSKRGAGTTVRGDELELIADVGPLRLFRNAALADPFDAAARQGAELAGQVLSLELLRPGAGLLAWIDHARARVRARILATYAGRATALGRALILGENDLDAEDGAAFRKSGLMHLLAVSGTHLVMAVLALVQGLRALLVRIGPVSRRYDAARLSAGVGVVLSLLYADFAGGSGSAWRAAYMLALVLGARIFGLRVSGAAALGGSLLVALAIDPLAGSDISFLLSALATAGLIGIGQPLAARLEVGALGRPPLKPLVASLVATLSATVACAPVLALMDGYMTLSALLANVVAGPLGELMALPACLLHAVVPGWPALEAGLARLGSGALLAVRAVALWSAKQESVAFVMGLPDVWERVAITTAFVYFPRIWPTLCSVSRHSGHGRLGCCVVVAFALAGSLLARSDRERARPLGGRLVVTALDVDQGDALVIDFPDGRLALLDGGGFPTGLPDTGVRVLLPYLRSRGRHEVDLMILSHAHPDHMLGLVSVAETLAVRELWLLRPKGGGGPDLERLIRAVRTAGGRVRGPDELCAERASAGVSKFGGAQLSVLIPCDADATWEELGENDRSLVIHIRHGARSALLTGDVEHEGERRLVAERPDLLRSDLLKVPHHGSDTSSGQPLLDAVLPGVALISCGVRNRFEHPRPSVLARLRAAGVLTLRTDRLGSVSWLTDGKRTWLRAFPSG